MITGIEHTAICSPAPKALAEWYVSTLGFVINYESSSTVFVKAQNGYMIEITTAEGDRAAAGMKEPGIRHFAVSVTDFDSVYDDLKAKNVSIVGEPIDKKGVKAVFFTDPEGNILHLLQRTDPLP